MCTRGVSNINIIIKFVSAYHESHNRCTEFNQLKSKMIMHDNNTTKVMQTMPSLTAWLDLVKGYAPFTIFGTCTSSCSYRHSLSTSYCWHKDEDKCTVNCCVPCMLHSQYVRSFGPYVATELSGEL